MFEMVEMEMVGITVEEGGNALRCFTPEHTQSLRVSTSYWWLFHR